MICAASTRFTAPLSRSAAVSRRCVRKAVVRPVAIAFPTDSEEVTDLLKGKSSELQDKASETVSWAKAKWEASDNKPGIVATGSAALFGLYLTSGVISTIDRLPLMHTVFELLGLSVTAWFAYRWFFVAGEKEAITSQVSRITKDIGLDL
ncbi:Protein CURVATURE THYLAKOID 1A [Chlorella vulgaris]